MIVLAIAAVVVLSLLLVALVLILQRLTRARRQARIAQARRDFHGQREGAEARFVKKAAACGRPRGLIWKNIDFADEVSFARDRQSGQLMALVSITISFEAVKGGDMEHVEAVGNLRAGTAVFHFDGNRWNTQGRAIFNLEPLEALEHFQNELEVVE